MNVRIDTVLEVPTVRRLREVVGRRQDAVVALGTTDGALVWVSRPGAEWVFGRSPADVEGTSRFDYIHPLDLAAYRRKHDLAVQGKTVRYSVRASTADGDWQRVNALMWLVHTEAEPLLVSVSVPTDVHASDG